MMHGQKTIKNVTLILPNVSNCLHGFWAVSRWPYVSWYFWRHRFPTLQCCLSCFLNGAWPSWRVYKNVLNTLVILTYFLPAIFGPKLTLLLTQGSEAPWPSGKHTAADGLPHTRWGLRPTKLLLQHVTKFYFNIQGVCFFSCLTDMCAPDALLVFRHTPSLGTFNSQRKKKARRFADA
jgi:hypothetical protein